MPHVAVIGGSGVYDPSFLHEPREEQVDTPYGPVQVWRGRLAGGEVTFLQRHGPGHRLPPHRIAYRANIWALWRLGAEQVIATSAVGSLRAAYPPGSLARLSQFIDFTQSRPGTFFDGDAGGVVHVDLSEPYCPRLGELLDGAARRVGVSLGQGACYVCVEGPRYETAAEISMFRQWGGDLVGMTNVPEVVLAREAGLCYAGVALVTNWGAGITPEPLSHDDVLAVMARHAERLKKLLRAAVQAALESPRSCPCRERSPGLQGLLGKEDSSA